VLAGYGIGTRLEFLLVPITFAFGVAAVPMVGMAIGARRIARAREVAWTASLVSAGITGGIGVAVALSPGAWSSLFTAEPRVIEVAHDYLKIAGPAFACYGFGLCLYFASQGSGQMLGPVIAQGVRLAVVAVGAAVLTHIGASARAVFLLVAIAFVAYGLANWAACRRAQWGARSG
jgi:Na+-driven multidrug efflux pump